MEYPTSLTALTIPEMAAMISLLLGLRDIARLSVSCKSFFSVYNPLLWKDYTFDPRKFALCGKQVPSVMMNAVRKNACLIRSVDVADDDLDLVWTLSSVSDTKKDGNSRQKQTRQQQQNHGARTDCINLKRFSFLVLNNEDRCSKKLLFEGADRLCSLLTWNTGLTYLCLGSTVVLYCEGKSFLDILLSMKQLRALTISMSVRYHTFPTAIVLAMNLLNRHQRLEELDFARWMGNSNTTVPFRKEKRRATRQDHVVPASTAEDTVLEELGKRQKSSSLDRVQYPRLKRIALPPRFNSRPYPTQFLLDFFIGCPNLKDLTMPHFELEQGSTLGKILREKCVQLSSITFPKKSGPIQIYTTKVSVLSILAIVPIMTAVRAEFIHLSKTGFEILSRHLGGLTHLELTKVMTLTSEGLHDIMKAGQALKVLKILGVSQLGDYQDHIFEQGDWTCLQLEELSLYDLVDERPCFWRQVARLTKLRELEVGISKDWDDVSSSAQAFELLLGGEDHQQQESGPVQDYGQLQLLGGLKNLRALKIVSQSWPLWRYPGQAEVDFIDTNWPRFEEFSYKLNGAEDESFPLVQDQHWRWLETRRPGRLRVLGLRPVWWNSEENEEEGEKDDRDDDNDDDVKDDDDQ